MSNLLLNDRAFSTRSDVSKVSGKADWRAENQNAAPMRSRSPSISCSKNGKPLAMAPLASFTFPSGQGHSSNFRSDEVAGQPIDLKGLAPQRSQSTDVGGLTVSAEPSRDDLSSLDEHSLSRSWALWEKTVAPDDRSSSESDCESVASAREPTANYNAYVSHIKEFNSIESFMTLFNGIPPPSAIVNKNHIFRQMKTPFDITTDESSEDETASRVSQRSCSILGRRPIPGVFRKQKQLDALMFFETGVTPVWEDPAHKNGGVMEFTFKTDFPGDVVDEIWERLLFSILGNSIPNGEFITGIRMADRLPPKMTHFNAIVGVRLEVWHREMTHKMCDQLRKHFTEVITAPLSIGGNVIARRTVHKGSYATKTPIFYVKRAPPSAEREANPTHRRGSV